MQCDNQEPKIISPNKSIEIQIENLEIMTISSVGRKQKAIICPRCKIRNIKTKRGWCVECDREYYRIKFKQKQENIKNTKLELENLRKEVAELRSIKNE